jgi:hypothetical protein
MFRKFLVDQVKDQAVDKSMKRVWHGLVKAHSRKEELQIPNPFVDVSGHV